MPLPDANKKSPRVYTNLQNLDLDNVTFANVQATGNPINVEEANEDELRRLVLVNLARLVTAGEWSGLLSAGSSGGLSTELTDYDWNGDDDAIMLAVLPPWGTAEREYAASGNDGVRVMWPFISPHSGAVTSVNVYVNGASGGTGAVNIGFYEDDGGKPSTFLGEYVIATTSTGIITQTTASDTVTLTRGTQYWIGQYNDNFASGPTFGNCKRQTSGTGLSTATSGLHGTNVTMEEASSSGNATISDWDDFVEATTNPINIGVLF